VTELRIRLKSILKQRLPERHEHESLEICTKVINLPELQNISRVAAYWPVKGEVNICPALSHLLQQGVQVFLPRIDGQDLVFVESQSLDPQEMHQGPYGIPYPNGVEQPLSSMDCILVPGLGFDRHCNRLGRGGGFYDRALSGKVSCPNRIGVGFSDQIVEEGLDPRSHDVPMQIIVTDKEIYRAEHDQD
jgi:5-formyltetrahydrofolate cyclo-ligase